MVRSVALPHTICSVVTASVRCAPCRRAKLRSHGKNAAVTPTWKRSTPNFLRKTAIRLAIRTSAALVATLPRPATALREGKACEWATSASALLPLQLPLPLVVGGMALPSVALALAFMAFMALW